MKLLSFMIDLSWNESTEMLELATNTDDVSVGKALL